MRSGAGQGGAIRIAKALGIKVVVDQSLAHPTFMETVLGETWGPKAPFWRLVLKDCAEADILLVNSEFVKETFIQAGYPGEKIRVAYLGVREDFWLVGSDGCHSGIGSISASEPQLLFTGQFGRRKGADILLDALWDLKKMGVKACLQVVGDCEPEYARRLEEVARTGFARHHKFVPQEKLKDYLARADIFVFPSRAEGCACSGMEAMAAGLCVIATRESGLPIEHEVDGLLIPVNDAGALARQVEWLVAHPKERRAMGQAAARKIRENMTWARYAVQVCAVYQELMGNGVKPQAREVY